MHAGGEENGRLRDAHQQVGDGQVDDEDVGGRAQAAAPAKQKKKNHHIPLTSQQPADARNADVTWHHLTGRAMKTAVRSTWILPAECVDDQEVADHARDADGEDD